MEAVVGWLMQGDGALKRSVEMQRECETPRPDYEVQQIMAVQNVRGEERRGRIGRIGLHVT